MTSYVVSTEAHSRLDVLVKPVNSLQEGLFLSKLSPCVLEIGSDSETVSGIGVEGDLPWDVHVHQNRLSRMTLLCWENLIRFSCSNRKWTRHTLDLVLINKTRMSNESRINLSIVQKSGNVFGAKAVPNGTQLLNTELALHLLDALVYDWVDNLFLVSLEPIHDLEALWWVQLYRVAMKEIWEHDKVAICSVLVCEELGVYKFVADNVGKEEDCIGGRFVFWIGKVAFSYFDDVS